MDHAWQTKGSPHLLAEGPHFGVYRARTVNPGGGEGHYDYVHAPDTVRIIALHQGRLAVIEQEHYLPGTQLRQLPGGTLRPGEDHLVGAQRELREETGLEGGTWRKHQTMWPLPGLTTSRAVVYSVVDPNPGIATPEVAEADIKVVWLTLAEAAQRVQCAVSAAALFGWSHTGTLDHATVCG